MTRKAEAQQTAYVRAVPNLPYSNLVSRVTDALGSNTDLTYDSLANALTATRYLNSAPITTTYAYEPTFNRVATISDPLSHTTTFTYEAGGARNLQSITEALSRPKAPAGPAVARRPGNVSLPFRDPVRTSFPVSGAGPQDAPCYPAAHAREGGRHVLDPP